MTTWVLDPDVTIDDPEVRALVLETDIEVYVHLTSIRKKRCANCGDTATVVRLQLEGRNRQFFCDSCSRVV